MITDAQERVLRALRDSIDVNGISPSMRELSTAVGQRGPATVHFHLRHLEDAGLVTRRPDIPRSLRLTPEGLKLLANGKAEAVTG